MIRSLFIGPRRLLNDCNHFATAIFWRSAITVLSVRSCQSNRSPLGLSGRAVRDKDENDEKSGLFLRMERIAVDVAVHQSMYALNKVMEFCFVAYVHPQVRCKKRLTAFFGAGPRA